MFSRLFLIFTLSFLAIGMNLSMADTQEKKARTADVLERLFRQETPDRSLFAPSFLAQVPYATLVEILAQVRRDLGPALTVETTDRANHFRILFRATELPTQASLDAQGRIAGLLMKSPIALGDLQSHLQAIAQLPGKTSLLLLEDGKALREIHADAAMAVGSAFKLHVLARLAESIDKEAHAWDEVIALTPQNRSLPSGILQEWPNGTSITLASLAALMISRSDNTAADELIALLGKEGLEQQSPANTPYLKTREMFALKQTTNADLLTAWQATSDVSEKRDILKRIKERPAPTASDLRPDVPLTAEWFYSARDLCKLLDQTSHLPALSINPGPAGSAGKWSSIAYKGGSETGVLNLSTLVTTEEGKRYCLVASWNHDGTSASDRDLFAPYQGILQALADRARGTKSARED